jgi:hypothetical protein
MTEPTVEEIVAKADQCGNLHGRELRRLIASWRERGEALEECASDLEAEARRVRAALAAAEHTQGGGE